MPEPGCFRSSPESSEIELQCPHCRRSLFVHGAETSVSVLECPHPDCHLVIYVWTEQFRWLPQKVRALTLPELTKLPVTPQPVVLDLAFMLPIIGMFVCLPLWMMWLVWGDTPRRMMAIFLLTCPALSMGLPLPFAAVTNLGADVRRRRKAVAERHRALTRVRWLPATLDPRGPL